MKTKTLSGAARRINQGIERHLKQGERQERPPTRVLCVRRDAAGNVVGVRTYVTK